MKEALIIVEPQRDFGEKGGTLYAAGGELVIPAINREIEKIRKRAGIVIASREKHGPNHRSFITCPPELKIEGFSIWPPHCVDGTRGAEYMDGLNVKGIDIEVVKGFRDDDHPLSAFGGYEFRGGYPLRSLNDILIDHEIRILKIAGFATEYCDMATALDGLDNGYRVELLLDCIRPVDINAGDGERAIRKMEEAGVIIVG